MSRATRQESMKKMGVFAETVSIISRNYFQGVRAVMAFQDTIHGIVGNKNKCAEYDFLIIFEEMKTRVRICMDSLLKIRILFQFQKLTFQNIIYE
ncbi:MAG: hypothetical protein CO079_01015 [Nitrosopumilales archaeon CG_4_9_14_0_8_um_filter_34_10]|nr:MAG: hypothetical protein CO079_01015 [Nitrosopumilales archaeon CG_4_9_14_0_8_um_filter_34_10]